MNLVRRGRWYSFRRRIPANLGGGVLQIPIGTDDHRVARRAAAAMTAATDDLFGRGAAPAEVRRELELIALEKRAEAAGVGRSPGFSSPSGFLGLEDGPDSLGSASPSGSDYAAPLPPSPLSPPSTPLAPHHSSSPLRPSAPRSNPFDPSILAVAARMCEERERGGSRPETTALTMSSVRLLVAATGVDDVRQLRQHHLAAFRDLMSSIPKSHGRSSRTRGESLDAMIARAECLPAGEVGLAAGTVNRNLGVARAVIRSAAAEGIPVDQGLDAGRLRRRDPVRPRDKRQAFTVDEVRAILRHPVFTGSAGPGRNRRAPGAEIIRDALYWIPLIAAYTGARREEIAGLDAGDVEVLDGVPVFRIRPNLHRALKNAASERVIPVHQDLLRLGLVDERKEGRIFSDLRKKHARAGWGESIAYMFDRVLDDVLGSRRGGKSFHSLRHYATDELRRAGVPKPVRMDLLGHAGEDLEDEVYGSRSRIRDLAAAIAALPSVMPG